MDQVRRWAPAAWALALAVLLLGPALAPGYLLTYDMVWVPDLALRGDFLGLGTALPRAVPSDAVVAVLDQVVPGMLLQKVVLLGGLVLGGIGAARLAGPSLLARLVATSVYVWSPFVVERLWIGHWPVLLCWAVLPWVVLEGVRFRDQGRLGAALPFLLLAGSLSVNAGLMTAAAVLAVGLTRRGAARLVTAVVAANAPWLVAGLLHAGDATSSAAGSVFGLHGDGLPAPLAALTLGGIWNADVVPGSRDVIVLPLVYAVALVAAAVAGARPLWRRLGRRTTGALIALWVAGYAVALLSWAAPDALGAVAEHVPGGGVLRDGTRFLALCAPLTAALVAAGAVRLAEALAGVPLRVVAGVGAALLPLALMPDAGWGISGELRTASYPGDYAAARATLADDRPGGDLLVLPFSSYRAPAWNHGRPVLDPLPRYLQPDYVVDDRLSVDGRLLAGEDPRGPEVLAALALPDPEARAAALGRIGIGLVARETDTPQGTTGETPVAGTPVYTGDDLEVIAIDTPVRDRGVSAGWWIALALAWGSYLGVLAVGGWNVFQFGSATIHRKSGSG
ncbi:hypothetical protein [Nocardioides mangrovi]|uniref:YfhO family protein n=1 Tax=Nocardioides mangrovi TaxID=2874580 RepID=A0ABS7U7L5_9ACTN|nr:hypothetical protein [Nocardioides mangrovi]MBZ5736875.1 hypothetical protein [Nocardioides mangrovi]